MGLTFPSVKNSTAGATFDESTLSKLAASTRTLVERKLAQIHERYSVEAFQMRLGKKNSQRPSEAGSGRQKSVTARERKRRLPPDSNKPKSRSAAAAAAPSASQMKGGSAPKRKRVQNQVKKIFITNDSLMCILEPCCFRLVFIELCQI